MVHMLFAYHRPSLAAELLGSFSDYSEAWKARIANERRLLRTPGTEVVVLSGPDELTIRRTHARYFSKSTVDESIERAFSDIRETLRLPREATEVSRSPIAVLCTSDAAFQPARLSATLSTVSEARAALSDCGQTVEYAGHLTEGLSDNDLIVWVCGASTRPAEWEELINRPNPVLSLGVCLGSLSHHKANLIELDPAEKSPDQLRELLQAALRSLSVDCNASH